MLHYETITPATRTLLEKLSDLPVLEDARLVGGTALALHLGHRTSVDLDFFGNICADTDELRYLLSEAGRVEIASASKNINVFWIDGIKVDMVNYPYPWIDLPAEENGIRLASTKDIAAMKIAAIVNRGTKKDFVDLYTLLQYFTLDEILAMYSRKYSDGSLFIVMKSLIYFADAEEDPMPEVLTGITWEKVKNRIREVVTNSTLDGLYY